MSISNLFSPNDFNLFANTIDVNSISAGITNYSPNNFKVSGKTTVPAGISIFPIQVIDQSAVSCAFTIITSTCGFVTAGTNINQSQSQVTYNYVGYNNNSVTVTSMDSIAKPDAIAGILGQSVVATNGPNGFITISVVNATSDNVVDYSWSIEILESH